MSLMFDHFADEGILNTWVQGLTRLTEIITSTAAAASAVAAGGASKDEQSVAPAPLSLQLDGTLELVLYATMLIYIAHSAITLRDMRSTDFVSRLLRTQPS